MARHCRSARSRVASPTRAPKTGIKGRVARTITALVTSCVAITTTVSNGRTEARTSAGR